MAALEGSITRPSTITCIDMSLTKPTHTHSLVGLLDADPSPRALVSAKTQINALSGGDLNAFLSKIGWISVTMKRV